MIIGNVICIEGNGCRPSHHSDGFSLGGVMYTLNITEVHSVCYAVQSGETEKGEQKIEIYKP